MNDHPMLHRIARPDLQLGSQPRQLGERVENLEFTGSFVASSDGRQKTVTVAVEKK